MIVSWNWLKQYVPLDMPLAELEERLMMSGLNHEGTEEVGGDIAIDLEVTSNRPDCLGHIGVAREIAVLWGTKLTVPAADPPEGKTPVENLLKVKVDCPELCYRYTARVIRGVQVAASPKWMVRRLASLGIAAINNVVDISNYVLMECGQPLHTFDFGKLSGSQIVEKRGPSPFVRSTRRAVPANGDCPLFSGAEIIVRRPEPGETIEAIDHKTYELDDGMCMICDARRPVAIGGVMGGAQTEISAQTTDVLIEAADFDPVSIRNTARKLNLHSDSSYRFERRVDCENIDWASRRCCELILDLAGGELARGVVDVAEPIPERKPIVLRFSQLKRVLGIDVEPQRVREILAALGNEECAAAGRPHPGPLPKGEGGVAGPGPLPKGEGAAAGPGPAAKGEGGVAGPEPVAQGESVIVVPPSWRRDLAREIDLVEEVARVHGYDKIPEDVGVPMVASTRRQEDRVTQRVRSVLCALGFDEAMTYSVLDEPSSGEFTTWTDAEPLRSLTPVLRGADRLRTSLVPSLLLARRTNEALANPLIELFEIAKVYLPRGKKLPDEQYMLGITSGRDYAAVKGAIEAIVAALNPAAELEADSAGVELLEATQSCRLKLAGELLGYVGRVSDEGLRRFELRSPATVAEVRVSLLVETARLIPRYVPQPPYPAVSRDLNLVVDEPIRWADVAATVRANCGEFLEELQYRDTYHDPERLGAGKKSLLMTVALRSKEGTMTNQQADAVREKIVAACRREHAAELR